MLGSPLKTLAAALLALGLAGCSHSGHGPMMGTRDEKMGCAMMQRSAGQPHAGQMAEKDKSQMMPMGCSMMESTNKHEPKADAKPAGDDEHAEHHPK